MVNKIYLCSSLSIPLITLLTASLPAPTSTLDMKVSMTLEDLDEKNSKFRGILSFLVSKPSWNKQPRTHTPMGPMPGPPPPWGMQKVLWRFRCETSDPKSPGRQIPTYHKRKEPKSKVKSLKWCSGKVAILFTAASPFRGKGRQSCSQKFSQYWPSSAVKTSHPTGSLAYSFYGNSNWPFSLI